MVWGQTTASWERGAAFAETPRRGRLPRQPQEGWALRSALQFSCFGSEESTARPLYAFPRYKAELCGNTAVFAKSLAMLGNSEDNTALSRALSQLAEVEDKMEQLHQEQAASDFFIFEELLADYIRLLGAVRVGRQLHGRKQYTV